MSISSRSLSGIRLNTTIKFLNIQTGSKLRRAQNDSSWCFFAKDPAPADTLPDTHADSFFDSESWTYVTESRNAALQPHLQKNPYRTLYAHVKYKTTAQIVSNYYFKRQNEKPSLKLTALDLGCSVQMLRRHLTQSVRDLRYFGVDSLPMIYPDILCDVSSPAIDQAFESVSPDVVVALDLLPELHDTSEQLSRTLSRWLRAMENKPSLYVFTIPECYESDEHRLKLTSEQWLNLLEEKFIIEDIQAIGFLSALPYWAKKTLALKPNGLTHRTLKVLRDPLYDSHLLQTLELTLTRALRRVRVLRRFSHTIVVTAHPRTSS